MPPVLLQQVLIAGALLCVMSIVDTLSYGIRTAGVLTRRLAISLALFNVLVIFSRLGNMVQAPIIGNLPDKVFRGAYTSEQVLAGLRIDVGFIVGGVIIGAIATPTFIRLARRGIELMEHKGSMPGTILHGATHLHQFPHYLRTPFPASVRGYLNLRGIPWQFLIWNVFVTCFYSIGVMSTVLAASLDHSVAGTAILLSGIVNGIATLFLFVIVDPPAAIVIDQCINGKRPESDAKTINVYLVITRLLGCALAVLVLPLMGQYVLSAAHFVDRLFPAKQEQTVMQQSAQMSVGQLDYELAATETSEGYRFELAAYNSGQQPVELTYNSGARFDFILTHEGREVWSRNATLRFTQAIETEPLEPGGRVSYEHEWHYQGMEDSEPPGGEFLLTAKHLVSGSVRSISLPLQVRGGQSGH